MGAGLLVDGQRWRGVVLSNFSKLDMFFFLSSFAALDRCLTARCVQISVSTFSIVPVFNLAPKVINQVQQNTQRYIKTV